MCCRSFQTHQAACRCTDASSGTGTALVTCWIPHVAQALLLLTHLSSTSTGAASVCSDFESCYSICYWRSPVPPGGAWPAVACEEGAQPQVSCKHHAAAEVISA
jgi:hypothetical protein